MGLSLTPPPRTDVDLYGLDAVRACDLPKMLAREGHAERVPLTMLVKAWEDRPGEREAMIAEAPHGDDADDLCRIAAVVHALCDRYGVAVPDWVWQHRSSRDIAWGRTFPTSGPIWERTVEDAPEACAYHRVWFDHQFISSARTRVTRHNHTRYLR